MDPIKQKFDAAYAQLTQAGADSNKQAVINLRQVELDVAGGYSHVRLTLTVATAASLAFSRFVFVSALKSYRSASS